jgi:opacity protein-like surface antigen
LRDDPNLQAGWKHLFSSHEKENCYETRAKRAFVDKPLSMTDKATSMIKNSSISGSLVAVFIILPLAYVSSAADNSVAVSTVWQKPAWLTDLSLGVKESYDDNTLLVSGNSMQPQPSWVSTVSPKIGLNFAPLLENQKTLQMLSFIYVLEFAIYHNAPSESYDAHRINNTIKGEAGPFLFSLDNSFLYNDGSKVAPIYALNQTSDQNDKYRNFYAFAPARERRNQIQDRSAVSLQYDWDKFFVRPVASLLYYNLKTDWHNAGVAPFLEYQNWPDRYDVNGGADLGYKVMPGMAVTLGYRYGHQYQQQFPSTITSDSHYSSSDYQRVLVGLAGNPWSWLNAKLVAGPDFRDYNSMAPVNDLHPVTYYAEAVLTATLTSNQTLTFNYKQWEWVASTGIVPYFDSTFALAYHWNATKQLGLDLGGRIQEADFSSGNDLAGTAPSLRDDIQYTFSAGVNYAFTPHLNAGLTCSYDLGGNLLNNLPTQYEASYRNFEHLLVSLGVQYQF